MPHLIRLFLLFACLPWVAMASAPDLVLKDFDGNPRPANEFIGHGKWTIVAIWAHNCHVCNAEISTIDFFHDDHKNRDAQVLGVSIDGWAKRDRAEDFIKRHDLSFTNLLIEPDMAALSKFGGGQFIGTPTFYIYDPSGEIVARQIGPLPIDVLEALIRDGAK